MVRSSADGAARGQVSGDLIGREHAPGVCVSQSLPQVTHQFAIRQDLNRLSERSSARTVNTGSLTPSMLLASPDSSAGVPLLRVCVKNVRLFRSGLVRAKFWVR